MFRKIVSNISFSSALVGQLGFYAKRLRKEESSRRIGIFFIVLALIVQSLAVFNPPTSANAADSNDLVYGGIRPSDGGLSIFLRSYDGNSNGLRDIMSYFGISRSEIVGSKHGAFSNVASFSDTWYSVNLRQQGISGEQAHTTTNSSSGGKLTFYSRPWYRADNRNDTLWGFKGYSAGLASKTGSGTFYLLDICGNLIIKIPPVVKDIQVCDITTGNVVTIKESDFNASKHSRTLSDCNKVKVCDLNSNAIITISEKDFNVSRHSRNLDDCTIIKVCNLSTFTVESIRQTAFNPSKHSKNVQDCDDVTVCNLSARQMVTIKKPLYEANKSLYSTNPADCNMIKVCVLSNFSVITIAESAYDATKQSKDIASCQACPLVGLGKLSIKDPTCQACPLSGLESIAKNDPGCHNGEIVTNKKATNESQGGVDATTVVAKAGDDIRYTITAKNKGGSTVVISFKDDITDTLQYADIKDAGGGVFDEKTKTISWPDTSIAAGKEESRSFTVRVKAVIPSAPTGVSNETSYDCKISNVYGDKTDISIDCPVVKAVELVKELPKTGVGENLAFAGVVLAVAVFFYARSRQLGKEIRLIRRDMNAGVI